jgi:geranylgeranyl diphosphate synthase type I
MTTINRSELQQATEADLQSVVRQADGPGLGELHSMLRYHLGWEGEGAGPRATGKRVRPLLVLLTCDAAGGDWQAALPVASGVELLHNFSLIHDDIQDGSETRRGRPTLWARWGVAQAINAGDALFALAHLALQRLGADVYAQAAQLLPQASLQLTQGQYMDLAYENRKDLSLEDYWPMVRGKTAVLMAACTRLGALVAGAQDVALEAFTQFGLQLGLAFQAHDDILGAWGDEAETGKSAHSDLLSGKKSLPVLYGLEHSAAFKARWEAGVAHEAAAEELATLLREAGAHEYAEAQVHRLTADALDGLAKTGIDDGQGQELRALAKELVGRVR